MNNKLSWKPISLQDQPELGDLIGQQHSDGSIKKIGIIRDCSLRGSLSLPSNLLNRSPQVQVRESWRLSLNDREENHVLVLDVDYCDGNQVTEILCDQTTTRLGIGPRFLDTGDWDWLFDFIDEQQTEPITWVIAQ